MNKEKYAERLETCYLAAINGHDVIMALEILGRLYELTKGDNTAAQHPTPPDGYTTTHVTNTFFAASLNGPLLMFDVIAEEWVTPDLAAL